MPGDLENAAVKCGVLVRCAQQIAAVEQATHGGEDRLEVLDVAVLRPHRRVARGQPLEHGAGFEDLDRLALGHEPHPGAAVALVLDEALVLEPRQRGADSRAPHSERPGQLHLDEALVRL